MIVCLGWGSLVWDPQNLPVEGEWKIDGPVLPIEFVRQSINGRITLVIDPLSQPMPVLWAALKVCDLSSAVEQLRIREGTTFKNIGQWPDGSGSTFGDAIGIWAKSKGIDGVVWTALGPKFSCIDGNRPSEEEVVNYLCKLTGDQQSHAREYVEKAPEQIYTVYRYGIEAVLGWKLQ